MKNKKLALVIIPLLIIAIYLLISFPIQKYFAKKEFKEYIALQGTSVENIETERVYKDTKIGGYTFDIKYKDDPKYRYEYHYFPKTKDMDCIVYDSSNSSVSPTLGTVKYPPIE